MSALHVQLVRVLAEIPRAHRRLAAIRAALLELEPLQASLVRQLLKGRR